MKRHLLGQVSLLALLLFSWLPASADAIKADALAPVKAAAVDAAILDEMAQQHVVGVAIGIIRDGRVDYLKGYGLADREKKTPVTTETVFNWASDCKPLAAVAAMQLWEKNKLDLEADVRTYVPEFPAKDSVITMRHLLCHQSGIPHYSNGLIIPTKRSYATDRPFMDPVLALDVFNQSPLIFKPGEKVSYSSYAYILVSAVVQRAGTQSFDDQIFERIAKPLGMKSLELDVETNGQPHWSTGYLKNPAGEVVVAPEDANYWKHGAGGFKSNIQDFARWGEGLINHRLVSAEAEKRMWTPQKTSAGEATTWGLGFVVEDQGGLKISHSGKQDEATSRLVIYPTARHGVVVLCNCGFADTGKFSTRVYSALSGN